MCIRCMKRGKRAWGNKKIAWLQSLSLSQARAREKFNELSHPACYVIKQSCVLWAFIPYQAAQMKLEPACWPRWANYLYEEPCRCTRKMFVILIQLTHDTQVSYQSLARSVTLHGWNSSVTPIQSNPIGNDQILRSRWKHNPAHTLESGSQDYRIY